ncbi:MAG: hypothetical protein ACYC4L_04335 [Chloroflexota bacterium]
MFEFLEANWSLLVLGAVFVLMMRMHTGGQGAAHGGGCCGGHEQGNRQDQVTADKAVGENETQTEEERLATPVGGPAARITSNSNGHHSGGCH